MIAAYKRRVCLYNYFCGILLTYISMIWRQHWTKTNHNKATQIDNQESSRIKNHQPPNVEMILIKVTSEMYIYIYISEVYPLRNPHLPSQSSLSSPKSVTSLIESNSSWFLGWQKIVTKTSPIGSHNWQSFSKCFKNPQRNSMSHAI